MCKSVVKPFAQPDVIHVIIFHARRSLQTATDADDRRESLQKATSATQPAGDENSEADSRYRPTVWKLVQPWDLTGFNQTSAIPAAMMNEN